MGKIGCIYESELYIKKSIQGVVTIMSFNMNCAKLNLM